MSVLFSIIVPTFNSFHLMSRCLQSFEAQTYKNFEVIFIDDCSTDDTFERLCEWSQTTHVKNTILSLSMHAGPGAARNKGLMHCVGKYVTFVDADDYVENNFLETLLPYAEKDYDSIIFEAVLEKNGSSKLAPVLELRNSMQGDISLKNAFVYSVCGTCGKAYKTSIIRNNELKFGEWYRAEDLPFTKGALAMSERIFYIKKPLYHYVQVDTSIINSQLDKFNTKNHMQVSLLLQKYLTGLDLQKEIEAVYLRLGTLADIRTMVYEKKSSKEIKQYVSEYYSKQTMKNPYLKGFILKRYFSFKLIALNFIPLIRLMFWYVDHKK